ncbi:MAG: acyl-CoA dehydrogenase family protein [Actinomycetota bacterium]|nr:acyl-CoA dehydrogenase family protein [Actinomycetota bacterium]
MIEPGLDDTAAERTVRAEVRGWMDEHAAHFGRAQGRRQPDDTPEFVAASRAWQRALDGGGWGAVTWPERFGGRGFGPNEARIFREEEQRYAVRTGAQHTSVAMVGPTIIAHGSVEQHERLIDPIRRGDTLYCQLFSEPDAGSDLASLRTRAERDGDEWVVTGQKIWTSGAHHADRAILLARTDPDSRRHDGITYFLLDMDQPGVDVRPIVQINRAQHFNEVYLDEVRVADADRLGPLGEGWSIARTTLGAERAMIGSIRVDDRVDRLIAAARAAGTNRDPVLRQELAEAWIRATVLGLTSDRVLGALRHGGTIGPEASVLKLSLSTLFGRLGDLAMRVLGPEGMLSGTDAHGPYGELQDNFLAQWAPRIGGGTEQIQRNLIGERALRLPREPSPGTR